MVTERVQAAYTPSDGGAAGFSAATAPTADYIANLINEVSSDIDMALGSVGYSIPATTPSEFVLWCGQLCADGVAAIALKSLAPGQIYSPNGGPVTPAYAYYQKLYDDRIKGILNRDLVWPGAPMGNASLPSTYLTDNPSNNPFDDGFTWGQQPEFSIRPILRPQL